MTGHASVNLRSPRRLVPEMDQQAAEKLDLVRFKRGQSLTEGQHNG